MSVAEDVTIAWHRSPRTATYAAPRVALLVQDNHDSLGNREDSEVGKLHPDLISSAGKENLGGGTIVGVTSTLQNTQILFDARTTPASSSTVTTGDAAGENLIDIGGTFETDGVDRGFLIINFTDQSMATVLDVNGEGDITSTQLTGGADNQYDVSDDVKIYEVFEIVMSGGNIVAVDDMDAEIPPILPTFGVMITKAQASQATITETGVSGLTAAESAQLSALPLLPAIVAGIWDEVLEGTTNMREAKRLMLAALQGVSIVPSEGRILYKGLDGLQTRLDILHDAVGARTSVSRDGSP